MHARSETPTYAVTLQLLGHRHRGRHRPAGGPPAIALACTSRLADGGLVQSSKQHEHRGRRRWRVGLVPEPRPPICNSASNSIAGLFHRDRHLHLQLAAEALAKAEGQAKSKI